VSSSSSYQSQSNLEAAQKLDPPKPIGTQDAAGEDLDWWNEHSRVIYRAWREWEQQQQHWDELPTLDAALLVDQNLREAIEAAYDDPSKEEQVKELFESVAPGVYKFQLFDPNQIHSLRTYIDKASYQANIPYKRPNSMNRYGLIINPPNMIGALNIQALTAFYQQFFHQYIRPLGSLFFPETVSHFDDDDSYAFTIRYKADEDLKLDRHFDTSIFTINININQPGESYEGATLQFLDDWNNAGEVTDVTFEPGTAVLHLGRYMHQAKPIVEGGERTNLVIWVRSSETGHLIRGPYEECDQKTREQRWTRPAATLQSNVSNSSYSAKPREY
jgi:hypothetical protein